MSSDATRYSSCGRPFRLQLTRESAAGFEGPASAGRCQAAGCLRFEWCNGARFCRECWLRVFHQDHLPERWGHASS